MHTFRTRSLVAVAVASVSALVLAPNGVAQTPVKAHYTVSGGVLGAANYTRFRIDNGTEDYNW